MKKIREIPLNLAESFDLPLDVLPGIGSVTIIGGRQVRIEGHRGVLEYSQERIVVLMKNNKLLISGVELSMQAMNAQELIAEGKIAGVEWS